MTDPAGQPYVGGDPTEEAPSTTIRPGEAATSSAVAQPPLGGGPASIESDLAEWWGATARMWIRAGQPDQAYAEARCAAHMGRLEQAIREARQIGSL